MPPIKVIIAGGGLAGLSAAHELVKFVPGQHGVEFDVHVYEQSDKLGGKCVSQDASVNGLPGRALGEHGFRFFPWFYRHLMETIKEIPTPDGSVHSRLVESTHGGIAYEGQVYAIPRDPGLADIPELVEMMFRDIDVEAGDVARYALHLVKFATSCHARRMAEYETQTWAEFIGIEDGDYSPKFATLLESIPATLVAMKAHVGSARTIGNVSLQLMTDLDTDSNDLIDAVLSGPTDIAWLEPWRKHLEQQGVTFHLGERLVGLSLDPQQVRIDSLRFDGPGGETAIDVRDAQCICAVPIEAMDALIDDALADFDEALAKLRRLVRGKPAPVANMSGVQFFLNRDLPMLKGHVAYPNSNWALTSVSQPQFWREGILQDKSLAEFFQIPGLGGVLSAILSDWDTPVEDPRSPVDGKAARVCSVPQIIEETWRQLTVDISDEDLKEIRVIGAHLDNSISTLPFHNSAPLLVHPKNSYLLRPEAETRARNLYLASDYVRTTTDLATMEGANEAARRAVRALVRKVGVTDERHWPALFEFSEGPVFEAAQELDEIMFKLGFPHVMDASPLEHHGAMKLWHMREFDRHLDQDAPRGISGRDANRDDDGGGVRFGLDFDSRDLDALDMLDRVRGHADEIPRLGGGSFILSHARKWRDVFLGR